MSYRNHAFEGISALLLALFLTISCSPIKPGGGGSAEAKSSAAGTKSDSDRSDNEAANESSGGTQEEGEDATTATGQNSLPASQNSNDTALTERYNFAAVCGPLFGMSNDDSGLREGVLTNDEEGTTGGSENSASSGGLCLEGPSVSSFAAVQAFAEYDQRKADCVAVDGFWDPRGEDSNNPGENGECFDVEATSSGMFCDFTELESKMSDVFGVRGFIEGYRNLGWQVEQCVFSPSGPYLTLSTVVVDTAENQAHLISKVAFLEKISVVCEGKSGGVCDQVDSNPDAEVLFVSAPTNLRTKTVDELNTILAK